MTAPVKRAGVKPRPGTLYMNLDSRQWWVCKPRMDRAGYDWVPIDTAEAIVLRMRQLAVGWATGEDDTKWDCAQELLSTVGNIGTWR